MGDMYKGLDQPSNIEGEVIWLGWRLVGRWVGSMKETVFMSHFVFLSTLQLTQDMYIPGSGVILGLNMPESNSTSGHLGQKQGGKEKTATALTAFLEMPYKRFPHID